MSLPHSAYWYHKYLVCLLFICPSQEGKVLERLFFQCLANNGCVINTYILPNQYFYNSEIQPHSDHWLSWLRGSSKREGVWFKKVYSDISWLLTGKQLL